VIVLVGQIAGAFVITSTVLLLMSLGLGGVWVLPPVLEAPEGLDFLFYL